ncbi:MAG: biopolymer transporter ExbD [Saprospiraceae bacterium]|nr:biopolymer transporter ExbD [Saprospiraceae bacterium]
MARKVPEINAGSMADIAFLLLIFFLVTTTMDVDSGITRKLPPPLDPNEEIIDVKERNIFVVLVNSADQLLVEKKPGNISTLRAEAKDFLRQRPFNNPKFPADDTRFPECKLEKIDFLGEVWKSKGVISLQNDRGTSYDMYINVQNELAAAVRELRDEMAQEKFGMKFSKLSEDLAKAIQDAIPVAISEAEPKDIGG